MNTTELLSRTPSADESARAAAHIEVARQQAALIPGLAADLSLRPINRVAIVGAGTMGSGIAMALANAAIAVTLIDTDAAALARGLARIGEQYAASQRRGKLSPAEVDQRLALITGSLALADAASADLVIEAVFEDLALKRELFARLDAISRPGAILATNTSGLDIDAIAAATSRPQDVIGAHFFSPAQVMKLLEVVRGRDSADDVVATLMDFGPRIGKTAVLARVHPGFIGNALFRQSTREAHFLLEEGAMPHQVDSALKRFGYAMGVFAVHDLAGNDVGYPTRMAQVATRPTDRRWCDLILRLVEMGRLGQKSSAGWYRYEAGSREPLRDPVVEDWLVAESKRAGFVRREISDDEIVKRCVYGLVNEGARLLEQGVALRPGDIDIVYLTGYGFPASRGGPMFLADQIGLAEVLADIRRFHDQHGFWWQPAPLLEKLVAQGLNFAQWQAGR
jgi:3-hydroxyacyl-CoA dehydrogenase